MCFRLSKEKQKEYQKRVADLEREVFTHIQVEYTVNEISLGGEDRIHTVFVPCPDKDRKDVETYFVGHGFSGSSIMMFPVVGPLLKKGNVIFW